MKKVNQHSILIKVTTTIFFLLLFGMTGVDAKSIKDLGFCMRSPDEMERLINLGVDNIITNRPDVLSSVLKKLSRNPFL